MSMKVSPSATQDADLPCASLPVWPLGESFGFLSGLRVVDLTTSIAGPYATMLLSDFGAEVIKIERPEGDDSRQWGPPFLNGHSLWFNAVNRNKKSVTLDLRRESDFKKLMTLVASADVFVTNQPPNVQQKLKLDHDSLKAVRADLIFVSITGFGLTGERADFTCYDLVAEGYSGIMDITGAKDGPAQKVGAPAADMLAGQDAAMAAMGALFDRTRSGKGRKIDISLVESMTRFLTCRISTYLGSGEVPQRSGGTDSVIAVYQAFDTSDRPINLALGTNAIWARFWEALGDEEFGARREFTNNSDRREHRAMIVAKIQDVLLTKPRSYWLELFAEKRIPAGPINRIDEVAGDAPLQERGMFFNLENGQNGPMPQIGLGIHIDGQPCVPRSAPPRLGEHNAEFARLFAAAPTE